jgi:hypothetical protein
LQANQPPPSKATKFDNLFGSFTTCSKPSSSDTGCPTSCDSEGIRVTGSSDSQTKPDDNTDKATKIQKTSANDSSIESVMLQAIQALTASSNANAASAAAANTLASSKIGLKGKKFDLKPFIDNDDRNIHSFLQLAEQHMSTQHITDPVAMTLYLRSHIHQRALQHKIQDMFESHSQSGTTLTFKILKEGIIRVATNNSNNRDQFQEFFEINATPNDSPRDYFYKLVSAYNRNRQDIKDGILIVEDGISFKLLREFYTKEMSRYHPSLSRKLRKVDGALDKNSMETLIENWMFHEKDHSPKTRMFNQIQRPKTDPFAQDYTETESKETTKTSKREITEKYSNAEVEPEHKKHHSEQRDRSRPTKDEIMSVLRTMNTEQPSSFIDKNSNQCFGCKDTFPSLEAVYLHLPTCPKPSRTNPISPDYKIRHNRSSFDRSSRILAERFKDNLDRVHNTIIRSDTSARCTFCYQEMPAAEFWGSHVRDCKEARCILCGMNGHSKFGCRTKLHCEVCKRSGHFKGSHQFFN